MEEFGENLDLCIIGSYYGTGKRGKLSSSFLCGLRVDDPDHPMKFWSFCKVGGGFSAYDLAEIRHITDDKWHKVDAENLPPELIELEGKREMPDMWIKPSDSLVFEVKGAQVIPSSQFRTGQTLRFPRFRRLRKDKDWKTALSLTEFNELQQEVSKSIEGKKLHNEEKKKRVTNTTRKKLKLLTDDTIDLTGISLKNNVFQLQPFYVVSDIIFPRRMSKSQLELQIKEHGGTITQSSSTPFVTVIGDRNVVKVASIIQYNKADIVKPDWIFECIGQKRLLTLEPRDLFFGRPESMERARQNVDEYGDSYYREVDVPILKQIFDGMVIEPAAPEDIRELKYEMIDVNPAPLKGLLFPTDTFYFDRPSLAESNGLVVSDDKYRDQSVENDFDYVQSYAEFCGGNVSTSIHDPDISLIVVETTDRRRLMALKTLNVLKPKQPRLVSTDWVIACWEEGTRMPEEGESICIHPY